MKLLLTFLLLAMAQVAFCQTSGNTQRINEIETEVEEAVSAGEYKKAAELREEKEHRLALEKAINEGNSEEVRRLKILLNEEGVRDDLREDNEQRLTELDIRLDEAVKSDNYKRAAELKEEREARRELAKALDEDNFHAVVRISSELYSDSDFADNNNEPAADNEDLYAEEDAPLNNNQEEAVETETEGAVDYGDLLKTGYYLEFGGGVIFQRSASFIIDRTIPVIKVSNGMRIFFSDEDNRLRMGLDIHFGSIAFLLGPSTTTIEPAVQIALGRPGFVASYALKENMAVDLAFNVGPVIGTGSYQQNNASVIGINDSFDYTGIGLLFSQSTRLRINKWAFAGVDLGLSTMETYVFSYSTTNPSDIVENLKNYSVNYVIGAKF